MIIDKELVSHVARLAHLKLTDKETEYYEVQLKRILSYVEEMAQLDLADKLGPGWREDTLGESTPERDDNVASSISPDEALANAPQKTGTAFQVPRIISEI